MEEFARCIRTGRSPRADGLTGYRIVRLAELATRAARQNRTVRFQGRRDAE